MGAVVTTWALQYKSVGSVVQDSIPEMIPEVVPEEEVTTQPKEQIQDKVVAGKKIDYTI